jgi:hypothetical protein
MMPDEERSQLKNDKIEVKLALILGLVPNSVEQQLFQPFVSLIHRLTELSQPFG